MNRSATTRLPAEGMSQPPLKPRTVSLVNIIRSAISGLPDIGVTLKGVLALVTTKPEKNKSIGLLLEQHAARQPDHIAIRYQQQRISYRQLNEKVNQLAHYFASQGISHGDTVGVMLENRPETLLAVLATVKLGAIASMFNTSQRGEVLEHSINLVKPKLLVVGEEMLGNMATVEHALPAALKMQLYFWQDGADSQHECPGHYQNLEQVIASQEQNNPASTQQVKMHQPCYYIFTSGTTGL
ncbi:MAG: AMP-binding protein, partial [Gammaproteobacteria bacterium]|nr:AMP-binding protein [Gammaproteobacteria bacterium]